MSIAVTKEFYFLVKRSSTTSSVSDIDLQMLLPSKSYSSISLETLKSIDDINFNIFKFQEEVGRDLTLPAIGNYIFASWNLFDTLNLKRFEMFLTRTRLGYKNNPYHNDIHAADVLQTTMIIFRDGKIPENAELSCLDISSVFVSCLLHDIGHPGLNNSYQMNKMTKIALKYNDKSVLENFHCYEGYKILINCDSNILEGLKKEEVRIFRKRLIESILATDMSSHTKVYAIVKSRIDAVYLDTKSNNKINAIIKGEDNMSKFDKQQDLINFIVHAADISNPAKSFSIYEKWTECINKEFFHQGDLEKKESLPVSFLCDRTTTNVPKSQIGFINSIVWPLFKVLSFLIPESRYYESQLENNAEIWKKQLESQTEKK